MNLQFGSSVFMHSIHSHLSSRCPQVIAGASASPVKKWLFERAMASKNSELKK